MEEPQNETQKKFLELLVDGTRTVREAADEAGYSEPGYGYTLVRKYKEYFLDRVFAKLVLAAPAAAQTLINGIHEKDATQFLTYQARKDFAKEILDRAGVIKADKLNVNVQAPTGLFILPAKEKEGEAVNG